MELQIMNNNEIRQQIRNEIDEVERRLMISQGESSAWNEGKYKNSTNAEHSILLVEAIKKQLKDLEQKLLNLDD